MNTTITGNSSFTPPGQTVQTPKHTLVPPKKGFVAQLRRNGFKIRVFHFRMAEPHEAANVSNLSRWKGMYLVTRQNRREFLNIHSQGGMTEIQITFPDGFTTIEQAHCSDKDTYCKRTGTFVAFLRAVQKRREINKLKS